MQAIRSTSKSLVQALACAVLAATAAQAAPAGTALERVEVQGQAQRADVLRACPSLQADLREALLRAQYRTGHEGSYRISFQLDRDGVSQVDSGKAPRDYRQPIRQGLSNTACQDAAALQQPQRFAFLLDVRNEARAEREGSAAAGELRLSVGVRELP